MPSTTLVHQRCEHHPGRQAASRCPSCRGYFCRECVTDHDGRLLCRRCLAASTAVSANGRSWFARLRWVAAAVVGTLFTWAVFYYAGSMLASLPSQIHGAAQ